MSASLARLDAFFEGWSERLNAGRATVTFAAQPLDGPPGLHTACVDSFVTGLGYQPIGGNWELLDAEGDAGAPRSARAALVDAFSHDMVFPQEAWLGDAGALVLAQDFIACFDPGSLQVVTNRMYFGWNPITAATIEWAFVAFDSSAIALLLATAEN
ncbi:hypothetical protein [Porphyrobacter sp. AAP60]|uniref:hypothetical protein n=1 Tax=Porphyrobacter sp. AAP60 TaxID=1523423 RepID=UPI0006B8F86B|nr:hypothetical protein [Porphyrobacter sp. AAP60]KPF63936.1 hypothetical protein IP79_09040 [Porphyrobacter sp. AAP60]